RLLTTPYLSFPSLCWIRPYIVSLTKRFSFSISTLLGIITCFIIAASQLAAPASSLKPAYHALCSWVTGFLSSISYVITEGDLLNGSFESSNHCSLVKKFPKSLTTSC